MINILPLFSIYIKFDIERLNSFKFCNDYIFFAFKTLFPFFHSLFILSE